MQIAVVMLAPGQTGFYDDLSGIHLSLTNKEAKVNRGTNTAGLVRAVKAGKIITVSGSLGSEALSYKEAEMAIPTYYRLMRILGIKDNEEEIVKQAAISEPAKVEIEIEEKVVEEETTEITIEIEKEVAETVVEEVAEEAIEEVVEEAAITKKKAAKKKKETKKED